MTVAALIQCTPGDLVASLDPEDYVIAAAKAAPYIDRIILACPDVDEAARLEEAAKVWGVEVFRGSDMNVAERLLGAAKCVDAKVVVRLLLRQFYMDVTQVGRMVEKLLATDADYIVLPPDYNYALAADVGKVSALEHVVALANSIENPREQSSLQFSPWVYVEEHPDEFHLETIDGGPQYDEAVTRKIRAKYDRLISENHVHFKWNYPASSYGFLGGYLKPTDTVLDIACGKGQGVRRLRESCARAVGVDLTPEHIDIAKRENAHVEGVSYELGNAETYVSPETYDAIVSLHTLEHLSDADAFFRCSRKSLKAGGKLLLEVPLLLPHPLGMPLMPWHEKEYDFQDLVDLVTRHGFIVDELWAKKRHAFVAVPYENGRVQPHAGRLTAGIVIAHLSNEEA